MVLPRKRRRNEREELRPVSKRAAGITLESWWKPRRTDIAIGRPTNGCG
jgi:hypothetical protein